MTDLKHRLANPPRMSVAESKDHLIEQLYKLIEDASEAWNTRHVPEGMALVPVGFVELASKLMGLIKDTVSYQYSGDPWEEDAFAMGEMEIHEYRRSGDMEKDSKTISEIKAMIGESDE